MVAEENDVVAGFMIYELHKTRLNVLNFAVHPSSRRMGVGGVLVAKLVYKLVSHHRQKINACRSGAESGSANVFQEPRVPGDETASQLLRR